MTLRSSDPTSTMEAARAQYFAANAFGDDGGYSDAWVDFKLGPVPFPFPNTPGRIRALRYHDLHHILTGYDTDLVGEFEISAWEIGAGCRDFHVAWALNLGGTVAGAMVAPKRIWRSFVRGRRGKSLYGLALEGLLHDTVAATRARMGADDPAPPVRPSDVPLFAAALGAGLVVGTLLLALTVPLVPVGLYFSAVRRREKAAAAAAAVR